MRHQTTQISDSARHVPAASIGRMTVPGSATGLSHGFEADSVNGAQKTERWAGEKWSARDGRSLGLG